MSILTTFIILSLFYGGGATLCYNADDGNCGKDEQITMTYVDSSEKPID